MFRKSRWKCRLYIVHDHPWENGLNLCKIVKLIHDFYIIQIRILVCIIITHCFLFLFLDTCTAYDEITNCTVVLGTYKLFRVKRWHLLSSLIRTIYWPTPLNREVPYVWKKWLSRSLVQPDKLGKVPKLIQLASCRITAKSFLVHFAVHMYGIAGFTQRIIIS